MFLLIFQILHWNVHFSIKFYGEATSRNGCKTSKSVFKVRHFEHEPSCKVNEERASGFTFAKFSRCFSWWHFERTKMIAGDVHLRRHWDRNPGFLLLQLLVPSNLNGSGWKTRQSQRRIEHASTFQNTALFDGFLRG